MRKGQPKTLDVAKHLVTHTNITENGCFEWTRSLNRGYGMLSISGKNKYAHRMSYMLFIGPIPDGMDVCHHCDNPPCINPAHLFLGTAKDNAQDARRKGRTTKPRGELHWKARLNPEKVIAIRQAKAAGETAPSLAARFGVSAAHIYQIVYRYSWKNVQ